MLPFGIYTIPEISMVGQNEQSLTRSKIPYEVGIATFDEVARAQIAGDQTGMLKIIFHSETLRLLGVHVLGDGASELVHIGQSVMMSGGTIETLRDTVFNYPSTSNRVQIFGWFSAATARASRENRSPNSSRATLIATSRARRRS
jgi:NAD(P) transhydrogenase